MSSSTSPSTPGGYFPHIDGLRTFAVLSVFLFHLDLPHIEGGFLGVDVFFVISGFLITRILKQDAEGGSFGAANFYARRVRRLFPALLVVMVFCLMVGYFRYSPERLVEMANSGIAAILSISNFYFYFNSDYFDAAAETQVFLHTWSLAVEEQFYLIWPLIIYVVVKYLVKSHQVMFVITLCVLGTIASYLGTRLDASMAFYMMPFRIAEFGLGAILCWLPVANLPRPIRESLVLAAFLTMLGSFVLITGEFSFPGAWFLVPCVATSVLIYLGGVSRVSEILLSNPVSTYIGKISYSLYLFHWPVIVLYRNEKLSSLVLMDQLMIFGSAAFLAIATYHFVEQPLRRPGTIWPTNRRVGLNFALGVVMLTSVSWYMIDRAGLPNRVPEEIRFVIENVDEEKTRRFDIYRSLCRDRGWEKCDLPDEKNFNVYILGDSHGADALNILQPQWPSAHYVLYSENGCPPMTIEDFNRTVSESARHYSKCLTKTMALADNSVIDVADMLVVSSRYTWYAPAILERFLDSLKLPADFPVIIFGQAPAFSNDLPEIVYRYGQSAGLEDHVGEYLADETWSVDDELIRVAKKHNATFIPKAGHFCDQPSNRCQLFFGKEKKLLTHDKHHMSYEASFTLGEWIAERWAGLLPKPTASDHVGAE